MTSILDNTKFNYSDNINLIVEEIDLFDNTRKTRIVPYGSFIATGTIGYIVQRIVGFEPIRVKLETKSLIELIELHIASIMSISSLFNNQDYFFTCFTDKFKLSHCLCTSVDCVGSDKYAVIRFDAVEPLEDHLMVG